MRRMPAAQRREQLIEAARDVFLELGYQGARTSDIADRAGINEALIYRHFDSKDDLFEAAVLAPLHAFVDRLSPGAAQMVAAANDEERRAVVRQVHEELATSMQQIAPLLGMAMFSQPARGQKLYTEHIAPLLEKMVIESREYLGAWNRDDFDLETVIGGMFGAHFWLALHFTLGRLGTDATQRGRQIADFAYSGLANDAPRDVTAD